MLSDISFPPAVEYQGGEGTPRPEGTRVGGARTRYDLKSPLLAEGMQGTWPEQIEGTSSAPSLGVGQQEDSRFSGTLPATEDTPKSLEGSEGRTHSQTEQAQLRAGQELQDNLFPQLFGESGGKGSHGVIRSTL